MDKKATFKKIITNQLNKSVTIEIDLGCGLTKRKGSIGIDNLALEGVDFVHDLELDLDFIDDNSIDLVYSRHFLEHVENFEKLLKEIHRILKPTGLHICTVPHFSNPYYYSDYTHKRFFGLYSFDYFATPESQLKRKSPLYYTDFKFVIMQRHLNFGSSFYFRNIFKQIIKRIVNISNYTKEFYEEVLVYWIPCYEITYRMKPNK